MGGAVVTNQLPIYVSYTDVLSSDQSVSAFGESDTATNNGTAVTALAAPSSGHTRIVKFMTVRNSDTASVTATVRLNNNGTFRILWSGTLAVGDTLQYKD